MKNYFIKGLSILALVVFGLSMAACGSEGANKKPEVTEEKEYEYRAEFEPLDIKVSDNQYIADYQLVDDVIYAVIATFPEEYGDVINENIRYDYRLSEINTSSGETKVHDWLFSVAQEQYVSSVHVNGDNTITISLIEYGDQGMALELATYSFDGELISEVDFSDAIAKLGGEYISSHDFLDDEKLLLVADSSMLLVNKDGSSNKPIQANGWFNNYFVDTDGSIYAAVFDSAGGGYKTKKADFEKGSLTDELEGVPENANLLSGEDGLTYAYTDQAFYRYDRDEKTSELLFSWINVNLSNIVDVDIKVSSDGEISFINHSWEEDSEVFEKISIKKVKITDENRIETITMATRYLDWDLRESIVKFNKANGGYKIEVIDYSEVYEDYDRQTEQIGLDVAAGKYDIFCGREDFASYSKAGAFEDLTPYFGRTFDGELFDNVVDSWKHDGKLYYFSNAFAIQTLAGNKNLLGNKEQLTMDDLLELRKKNPDIEFLSYGTMNSAFYTAITASIDNFVSSDTADCDFENEEFYKICEFAKTFPKDIGDMYNGDWEGIKNGSIIVVPQYLSNFDNIEIYNQLFDGNMGLYGYPSNSGNGLSIIANDYYAISSKSPHKDEAWEILAEVIIKGKKDYYNGFPILKSAYNDMIEEAMRTETYVDENGNTQKSAKGVWSTGDMSLEYYGASQELVDAISAIVNKASGESEVDEQVLTIITEEMEPFFAGQKSAEDVAKIIQSRVKLYLAETR